MVHKEDIKAFVARIYDRPRDKLPTAADWMDAYTRAYVDSQAEKHAAYREAFLECLSWLMTQKVEQAEAAITTVRDARLLLRLAEEFHTTFTAKTACLIFVHTNITMYWDDRKDLKEVRKKLLDGFDEVVKRRFATLVMPNEDLAEHAWRFCVSESTYSRGH